MFIDEVTLHIKAGDGGDGIVAWRHEKGIDRAGPGGGNGGNGGDVYAIGIRDIAALSRYSFEKDFSASDGERGFNKGMKGANGNDLVLEFPIGSVLKNVKTGEEFDLLNEEKVLILKGGRGGLGNEHFKGPRNVTPKESTPGQPGEESDFFVELKLVVDMGFVGMPNAGKSSLLNALTRAKAKVGNYQFTTLTPNVGDLYGFIIADIPGIIEHASEGKGLGFKFLRHVSRTKIILHCISAEHENILDAYNLIHNELALYSKELIKKPEYILITKSDLVSPDELSQKISQLSHLHKDILVTSVIDDASIKELSDTLVKIMRSM